MNIRIKTTEFNLRKENQTIVLILPKDAQIFTYDEEPGVYVDIRDRKKKAKEKVRDVQKIIKGTIIRKPKKLPRGARVRKYGIKGTKLEKSVNLIIQKKMSIFDSLKKVYTYPNADLYRRIIEELRKRGKKVRRIKYGKKYRYKVE